MYLLDVYHHMIIYTYIYHMIHICVCISHVSVICDVWVQSYRGECLRRAV